jgi:hypothetical protein
MSSNPHVDRVMDRLLSAIDLSYRATEASREAVQEILRRGAETGILFRRAPAAATAQAFQLTDQDRDFLRSFSIRPDQG